MENMNQTETIERIKSYNWEPWLERPFGPFIISLFRSGNSEKYFEKIGIKGVECEAFLWEGKTCYQCEEVWAKMDLQLEKYFLKHSIFDVTKSLEKLYKTEKSNLKKLVKNKTISNSEKLAIIYEIGAKITSYIWMAHSVEHYYSKRLKEIVPKYIVRDADVFIGDASFPKKKNAHQLFEEAINKRKNPNKIAQEFGWIRVRDGFSDPFSAEEIKNYKPEKSKAFKKVSIPKPLRKLFAEVSELVYFRTKRTDVLFELLFIARPIIRAAGEELGIAFSELKNYSIESLIEGKPCKYPTSFAAFGYKEKIFYFNEPVLAENEIAKSKTIKGMIAQKGIARGTVKIIKNVSELDKMNEGEILVTQMTFPSFIAAMKKAAGVITDEGGITCHAAIISRELKTPCIIGTKIATKILKDGDMVELDANKGEIKVIND